MAVILGLGGAYKHDSSTCLVADGHIVAFAEEERFNRIKHNAGSRSCSRSAAFCLARAGIRLHEVDAVVIAWNPHWPRPADVVDDVVDDADLIRAYLDPSHVGDDLPSRVHIVEHHVAHAASAFYCSGFDEAAILVVDGFGDGVSTSLGHGGPHGIALTRQYPFTQSLGWFYEAVIAHVGLGDFTSAGKLMGLAAYGEPRFALDFLRHVDGGYEIDLSRYGTPPEVGPHDTEIVDFYRQYLRACSAALCEIAGPAHRRSLRYDSGSGRLTGDTGFHPVQADLAASAQRALESCLAELARTALADAGSSRLCIAGGVGLNCSANGVLWRTVGAAEMFIQPAAGDAGCALGAALEYARRIGDPLPSGGLTGAALGPSFDDAAIGATLDAYGLRYTYHGEDIAEPVAKRLANGCAVGWFQGAMEAGPRALGHRSILADPRVIASRDRINSVIKRREMWRPLAPSILASAAGDFIAGPVGPAQFMIVAYPATPAARQLIPASVHVDGSLRPQLVDPATDPLYARLLHAVQAETGVPAVLNTSFNHEAEPIVCTPTDALRTFFSTPLDALAIGGYLLSKQGGWA